MSSCMIYAMSLKDWERDVINRQRNIVFPDTVLNEGRFYRNIVYGKALSSTGLRISVLVLLIYALSLTALALAGAISVYFSEKNPRLRTWEFQPSLYYLALLLFWLFVAVKGLTSEPRPRNRRSGYRRSSIK
ncbi:MAG TPA: hypothetical protein VFR84_17310 [Candidatus Angelobacter sp.]|nr:hypothetical protein [Candidatus Angelobacter sp.]